MAIKKGGRKSAAEKQAAAVAALVPGKLPEPPEYLTPEQAVEWRVIVATKPADWFTPDTYALLAQLCVHIITVRQLNALTTAPPDLSSFADVQEFFAYSKLYEKHLKMRDLESKRVEVLMRSLRLTHQSRWQPKTAGDKLRNSGGGAAKPWQKT